MSTFIDLTIYGLSNGAVLALAALGFVLIYKATAVINFAQGELLLIGAYVFYTAVITFGVHWSLGILLGVVFAVVFGVIIEKLVLRPMIGESAVAVIMVTIGLAAVLRGGVQAIYGVEPKETPGFLPEGKWQVGGTDIPLDRLTSVGVAAVVLIAFSLFFTRSRHGIAMRSVADDQQAALTVGIGVRRVFALAWVLAVVSALVGGMLLADLTGVSQNLVTFGLVVFPVVILGGLDSVSGTIVGGVIIGLLQQYFGGYIGHGWGQIIPYIVLVLILMIRPHGLFGQVRIERV